MADVQQADDHFSLQNRILRSEQRIARQRQIVEDLVRFKLDGPARQLLSVMEHTLAGLRQQEREIALSAPVEQPQETDTLAESR
jgi:hypothetical protein